MPGFNGQRLIRKVRSAVGWGRDYRVNNAQGEANSEAEVGAIPARAPTRLATVTGTVLNVQLDANDLYARTLLGRAEPDAQTHAFGFIAWLQTKGFAGRDVASKDLQDLYQEFCQAHGVVPRGWTGRGVGAAVGRICGGQKPRRFIVDGRLRQAKVFAIPFVDQSPARRRA